VRATISELSPSVAGEFEKVLPRLEGLTRGEIAELVTAQIVDKDAESFAIVTEGLSIETLRFPLGESPGGSAVPSSTDADVAGAWLPMKREARVRGAGAKWNHARLAHGEPPRLTIRSIT
jgi:hypothetical protein